VPDLAQIIRPWVVLDVTPPGVASTAPGAATSPTSLAIGKTSTGSSQQTTSGNYAYDLMCYMHSVVKERGSPDSSDGGGGGGGG
jgi:hypothetical protein